MTQSIILAELGSWLRRSGQAILLLGNTSFQLFTGKIDGRNTTQQLVFVGPASLPITLITAAVIGMIFTIQVAREFLAFGAGSAVGGILMLALGRELCPIMTAVVVAGRVGSAFAAEIGTMRVTEQIDALYMLNTNPVEYLVIPRLLACCIMVPTLSVLALVTGMMGGAIISSNVYGIANQVFFESIQTFVTPWDIFCGPIKGVVFGVLIAIIGCNWGLTTRGGAKGVGESTTAAVVTSLLAIFVSNFLMSWIMFQGSGSGAVLMGN
jgi:phospholipid/cholesterol/gamma-HCH transport system permease protein